MLGETEIEERIGVVVRNEPNAAARAAVAAVGAAAVDELFAMEARSAVAAVARLNEDMDLINEIQFVSSVLPSPGRGRCQPKG